MWLVLYMITSLTDYGETDGETFDQRFSKIKSLFYENKVHVSSDSDWFPI